MASRQNDHWLNAKACEILVGTLEFFILLKRGDGGLVLGRTVGTEKGTARRFGWNLRGRPCVIGRGLDQKGASG